MSCSVDAVIGSSSHFALLHAHEQAVFLFCWSISTTKCDFSLKDLRVIACVYRVDLRWKNHHDQGLLRSRSALLMIVVGDRCSSAAHSFHAPHFYGDHPVLMLQHAMQ